MFLIGGFKNGQKMNDLYRLDCDGKNFEWELMSIAPSTEIPEPRSGAGGGCI